MTAIRAGRLLDPEGGRILSNQIILVAGTRITRRRSERPDSRRRTGDRSVGNDRHGRSRRSAQPPRPDLQARAGEQHLLLHLRAGIDGAARDPGGVERHPDAVVRIHDRARHGQQRASTRTRRCARRSSRAGFRDRRSSTPASSSADMGGQFFPTPEMAKQHNIVYPGIPRRRHAGRNRQGGAAERAVWREGDQDLRRLQAARATPPTRSGSSSAKRRRSG